MVCRHAPFQALGPALHTEGLQVAGRQAVESGRHVLRYRRSLGTAVQADSVPQDGVTRLVASGPAEDEVDRRQESVGGQFTQNLVPPGSDPAGTPTPPPTLPVLALVVEASPIRVGRTATVRRQAVQAALPAALGHQVVGAKPYRAPGLHDHVSRPPHSRQPVAELPGIGDRRREGDHPDLRCEVQDHLLPDGPAVGILQEVDLVEDHPTEVECRH